MIDADHIVKGEGVSWFRAYLGEADGPADQAPRASVVASASACSACRRRRKPAPRPPPSSRRSAARWAATSARRRRSSAARARSSTSSRRAAELFHAMCDAEHTLGVKSFFVMDENFLLYKKRAMDLLEQMKEKTEGLVAVRLLVGQRAVEVHRCANWSNWASRGCGWASSRRTTSTRSSTAPTRSSSPKNCSRTASACWARPSSVSSTTRPRTSRRKSNTRWRTTPTSTSSCSTRRCPARRSTSRSKTKAGCCRTSNLADIHGQDHFNFKHAAISREQSKPLLDWAFRLDYEKNGPSIYRLAKTMMEGWRRYRNDPGSARAGADAACRQRTAPRLRRGALRDGEVPQEVQRRRVGEDPRRCARTWNTRWATSRSWVDRAVGPLLLWSARRDARKHPHGRQIEPLTFFERRNWPEGQEA